MQQKTDDLDGDIRVSLIDSLISFIPTLVHQVARRHRHLKIQTYENRGGDRTY